LTFSDVQTAIAQYLTDNFHQAKSDLSQLLLRVERGEEIIIADQGIPIAKLVPFQASFHRRDSLGQDRGRFIVPEDFNAPLPEDILAAFEGGS
jgi:prevent-host-death family protein